MQVDAGHGKSPKEDRGQGGWYSDVPRGSVSMCVVYVSLCLACDHTQENVLNGSAKEALHVRIPVKPAAENKDRKWPRRRARLSISLREVDVGPLLVNLLSLPVMVM